MDKQMLYEVVEKSDGCGGYYYVMEPVKGRHLTKEEKEWTYNKKRAVNG